ncbi:MAG: AMP-binding protein, partial [Acidimicrobiales bacterium]
MRRLTESYWPADTTEPLVDMTVGDLLRLAAEATPARTALVEGSPDPAGRRRWTYAEVLAGAESAAGAILAVFEPGDRVAVWAPNIPEWVFLEMAAGLAGIVLVTVNPADRPAELAYVLGQSRAAGIFYTPEYRGNPMQASLEEVRPGLPALRHSVSFAEWESFVASGPVDADLPVVDP